MFTSSDFGRGGGARDVICTLMSMSRGQQLIKMTRLGPHLGTVSAATASRQFGGVRVILNYHRRSVWEFFRQVWVGGRSLASVSLFLFIFFFGLCGFFVLFCCFFYPKLCTEKSVESVLPLRWGGKGFYRLQCGLTLNSRDQGGVFEDPALMALLAGPLLFI